VCQHNKAKGSAGWRLCSNKPASTMFYYDVAAPVFGFCRTLFTL
jgi:hypothetical protein